MKSHPLLQRRCRIWPPTPWICLLALALGLLSARPLLAGTNVVIWDTISPFSDALELRDRTAWKAVPSDLLALETDPPKASSDPGYYGREYSFDGDAVIENANVSAVFWKAKGRIVLFAKPDLTQDGRPALRQILELLPTAEQGPPTQIARLELLRNAADEVSLQAWFAADSPTAPRLAISLGRAGILSVKPSPGLKGVTLLGAIEHAVVPSFIGDDLIYGAADATSSHTLCLPAENSLVALLAGEASEFVMTWPKGHQSLRLRVGTDNQAKRILQGIDFDADGQPIYLAPVTAPGIWHKEKLGSAFLEKDVTVSWKKPFPARWKTQLFEEGVKTTFAFKQAKAQVWRGVPGSYSYPVWFSGDAAVYHLSKKVPPKGESLIYFLEPDNTPLSIPTPADILQVTLGRPQADAILDPAGRKLRTHHRRGGSGVRRACTCGCTEVIQAIFEAGEEVQQQKEISGAVDDMIFFVQRHVQRIEEYKRFAAETIQFLHTQQTASGELKPFLDRLEEMVQQIPHECDVQKENMKSLTYADDLAKQTRTLAGRKDPKNLKTYMDLLKDWRAMGGAQDYVVAQCHTLTRKLAQEAGYGCLALPQAVPLAQEVRSRCRQVLRNPDGYEIWAEY